MVGANPGLLPFLYFCWVDAMSSISFPHMVRGARGVSIALSDVEVVEMDVGRTAALGANAFAVAARSAVAANVNLTMII